MRETKTKEINGVTYSVSQLPPTQALDLLMDLVKMLGPALGPVFENVGTLGDLMEREASDVKLTFLGEAVRGLCGGLDKNVTKNAIKALASVTSCNPGGQLDRTFEAFFLDRGLGDMFVWLKFALEVQFSDFLTALGSAIKSTQHSPEKLKA